MEQKKKSPPGAVKIWGETDILSKNIEILRLQRLAFSMPERIKKRRLKGKRGVFPLPACQRRIPALVLEGVRGFERQ